MAGFMRAIRSLLSPSGGGGLDLPNLGMRSSGFDPPPEPTEAPRLSEAIGMPERPKMDAPEEFDGPGTPLFPDGYQEDLFDPEEMRVGGPRAHRGLLEEDPIYREFTTNNWRDRRPLENRLRRGDRRLESALTGVRGKGPLSDEQMPPAFEEYGEFFREDPEADPRRKMMNQITKWSNTGDVRDSPERYRQVSDIALSQALGARERGPEPTQAGLPFEDEPGGFEFAPDDADTSSFYGDYLESAGPKPSDVLYNEDIDPDYGSFEPMVETPPSRPMPSDRHMRWPQMLSKKLYG